MEMNQVRYFLAVCEYRNFTHAAGACNVAQPSLTVSIKKLEEEMGGPLFLRDRSGCRLTALGELVRPRLERIAADTREAVLEAARHVHLERVPIAIGIGETIGQSRLVRAVGDLRERLPRTDIELIVVHKEALFHGLREGTLDIGITSEEASEDLYRADELYTEGYLVVMPRSHPLTSEEAIPLSALAQVDLLDRPNCEMRDTLHAALAADGCDLYAAYRSNRVDWLLNLAATSGGVVVLPETAIPDDPRLVARPLAGPQLSRTVRAVSFRHQPRRPEVDLLVQALRRQ